MRPVCNRTCVMNGVIIEPTDATVRHEIWSLPVIGRQSW
jgi:hypothetical protein